MPLEIGVTDYLKKSQTVETIQTCSAPRTFLGSYVGWNLFPFKSFLSISFVVSESHLKQSAIINTQHYYHLYITHLSKNKSPEHFDLINHSLKNHHKPNKRTDRKSDIYLLIWIIFHKKEILMKKKWEEKEAKRTLTLRFSDMVNNKNQPHQQQKITSTKRAFCLQWITIQRPPSRFAGEEGGEDHLTTSPHLRLNALLC